jgi:hypothetical protein
MYVVRLKSIDGILNFKAFTTMPLALSNFEAGQNQAIDEDLEESALFYGASTDAKAAIQSVKDGKASLLRIYPRPMTEAQAAAWLADLGI